MLRSGEVEGGLAGLLNDGWDDLSRVYVRDIFVIRGDIAPAEVRLVDECDGGLVDLSREHLHVDFLLVLRNSLLNLNEWEVIKLHGWLVLINKDIDSIDGVFMHFLHYSLSHDLISSFLATHYFFDLLPHKFVVEQVFLFLLLPDERLFALDLIISAQSCVVGVFSIDSLVLDPEALSSMLCVSLLLKLLELFRAFRQRVHHFLTGLVGEEVDQTTGGLADNLLCDLMLFQVISRIIIDSLQNVVISEHRTNDFIVGLMGLLTLRKLFRNLLALFLSSLNVGLIIFAELFLALSKLASAANDLFFAVARDIFIDLVLDFGLTLLDVLSVGLDALHVRLQVIILFDQALIDNIVIISLNLAFGSGASLMLPGLFLNLVVRMGMCPNLRQYIIFVV